MRTSSSILVLASICGLIEALPDATARIAHETIELLPPGWAIERPALPDETLTLRIALKQSDTDGLITALYDVSTPSASTYGQYLSKEEVEAYVSPTSETVQAVDTWIGKYNVNATVISPAGDWLSIQVPAERANHMFNANFSVFTHTTGLQAIRTPSYSIAEELWDHVNFVYPTVTFPSPAGNRASISNTLYPTHAANIETTLSPCGNLSSMTPACLQNLYNIPSASAVSDGIRIAVPGYIDRWASQADLQTFLERYRPDMNPNTTFTVQTIDGGTNNQNASEAAPEPDLDTQYTVGLATGIPVTFVSVGGTINEFEQSLFDTAHFLLNETSPPQVMTTTYGDFEYLAPPALAYRLCNTYAQLGARGVSVLFGSGDGGVSGVQPNDNCTTFVPTFPSGCPYVTSVGGTVGLPQMAANFSSGGFSNLWGRPDYQASAVDAYLTLLGNNDTGLYNASGRAYPDVSIYAVDFEIIVNGQPIAITGTSCASPTFASIIALLNDQLVAAGRPVMGFLNPFLYSQGLSALTDITEGNNLACSNGTTGFYATVGWDPVTGLGTPDFLRLKAAVGL